MLVALAALLRDVSESRGSAPPCEMSLEAPMGCALGTCLGCVVPATGWSQDGAAGSSDGYLRVCMEGAVVDWRELDWERWPALGELVSRRAISVRPPADAVLVAS